MFQLAVILRAAQLYSHSAHHLCARTPFFQDHEFFSDTYKALEDDYDSVIERIIGTYGEDAVELNRIVAEVALKLHDCPSIGTPENRAFFEYQLKFEQELCSLVEEICHNPKASQGIIQLVGEIANQSEIRQYKIKRRIKQ
jgi:hypothetical protein